MGKKLKFYRIEAYDHLTEPKIRGEDYDRDDYITNIVFGELYDETDLYVTIRSQYFVDEKNCVSSMTIHRILKSAIIKMELLRISK